MRPDRRARARPAYKPLASALRNVEGGITMPDSRLATRRRIGDAGKFSRTRERLCAKTAIPISGETRFPTREMLDKDLALHRSYMLRGQRQNHWRPLRFTTDGEPTYRVIRGGAPTWTMRRPTLSTVSRRQRGALAARPFCMNWCMEQCGNIRIDTLARTTSHAGSAEQARSCATYCGVIGLENRRGGIWHSRAGRRK